VTARDLAGIDERFVRSLSLLRLHGLESSWASLGLTGSASIVGCNAFLCSSPLSPTSLSSSSPATLRSTAGGMAAGGHARGVGGEGELDLSASGSGGSETGAGAGAGVGAGASLVWTVRSASGRVVELVAGGGKRPVLFHERDLFASTALKYRLSEFDWAVEVCGVWVCLCLGGVGGGRGERKRGWAKMRSALLFPVCVYECVCLCKCVDVSVDVCGCV